jgi:hypothetical protein
VEVTYRFDVPNDEDELYEFQNGGNFREVLKGLRIILEQELSGADQGDTHRAYDQVQKWLRELCVKWEVTQP